MSRHWVVGCFALVACGEVVKITPDGSTDAPHADSAIDAIDCTNLKPDATFQYSPTTGSIAQPVTFTPTAAGLSYSWTFASGNPATSTAAMPSVTWGSANTFAVGLTATDSATTCSDTSMQNVRVLACQQPLASPYAFTQNTGGHADSGIVIMAKVNTTLTSFKVINQGQADTLKLLDSSNAVLQQFAMPATTGPYTATVSWPLAANTSYKLVTALNNNNQYGFTSGAGYPVQNSSLSVTGGWMDGANQTAYWFGYTDFVTCP